MIKFQCPNGHSLTTGDDRAGTAAKCPKCQVPLVVPMASTDGQSAAAAARSGKKAAEAKPEAGSGKQSAAAEPKPADSKVEKQPAEPKPAAPAGDLIVFLCPNGHKLNGPARLKGKAGQCPHCGAKFRIPEEDAEEEEIEDVDVEEVEDEPIAAESMTEEEFAAEIVDDDIEEITEFEEDAEEDVDELEPFEEAPPTVIDAFLEPNLDDVHPYAGIIAQLWNAKEPGQTIDLFLQKGEVFTPEFFAEGLSQPLYGVFGKREKEGGGHTLIMLPWDNITRIEIRHVKQLPVGLLK